MWLWAVISRMFVSWPNAYFLESADRFFGWWGGFRKYATADTYRKPHNDAFSPPLIKFDPHAGRVQVNVKVKLKLKTATQ